MFSSWTILIKKGWFRNRTRLRNQRYVLMLQVSPVACEYHGWQDETKKYVNYHTGSKRPEWLGASVSQFAKASSQSNAKEAEDKAPGT